MHWRSAAGVGLAMVAMAALGRWGGRDARDEEWTVPTATPEVRDFTVLIRAVGTLDSAQATVVASQVRGDRGKLIYIVADGAPVGRNDVVIRLDPTPFEEALDRLTALVSEKEAAVATAERLLALEENQAERDVKAAVFNAHVAELELRKLEKGEGPLELAKLGSAAHTARQQFEETKGYVTELGKLATQGFSNPTELEQARRKSEDAQRELEVAEAQYTSYRDYVLPTQIEQAQVRLDRARAEIDEFRRAGELSVAAAAATLEQARHELATTRARQTAAEAEVNRTIIRSPLPGMAVLREQVIQGERRKPQVGDIVWQNQPLVYVPDVSRMVVRTSIREGDLHNVEVGMPARVQVDAFPTLRLAGTVQTIGVLAETPPGGSATERAFSAVISIDGEQARLRPGMTARVEIRSAEVTEALTVPLQAVFLREGAAFCYVRRRGAFVRRDITLGAQNEDWAQVLGGIDTGDRVALAHPAPATIRGSRDDSTGTASES